jgi:hypothetical protein
MEELLQRFESKPGQINRRRFHNLRPFVDTMERTAPLLVDAFKWMAKGLDLASLAEIDAKIGRRDLKPQPAMPVVRCKNILKALDYVTEPQASAFLWMAAKLEPDTLIAIDRRLGRDAPQFLGKLASKRPRKPPEHETHR